MMFVRRLARIDNTIAGLRNFGPLVLLTARELSLAEDSAYALEPIREEAGFVLYRGRARADQSPILAVALAAEDASPASLRQLEHEFALASELDPAWAAQPLALSRYEGRPALILRDTGGQPLDGLLEQHDGPLLDLPRFLRIAIGLATAIGQVHRHGLIHKDLKPANVLVDETGRVWLTGFGIASRLPRERTTPAPVEIIPGTLAYMSPEQTGRMNRSMDTRSDLYSLGVILYQMLTGVLPFAAADALEWVHCHIARQPLAPADRSPVPEPLSAIIMRLLAKNVEERYQTAAGVAADLRLCLSQWQAHGRIEPFLLGTDDSSDRLLIPEKLYGREREVDTLLAAFDRVVTQGATEVVLVRGYSGVGKSSVVNELHKVLVPPRGLFAAGKFDQYKRDVPYATLAQAFQALMRQILAKSEAEVDHWRHALLEALGPNGQLMISLIPELEFIVGPQPPVAELPPREARGRFQLVFRRLLSALARPEHPLALFLDDLQWLDTATLELLEHLVTAPDVRHVLLIGAYRDNEVSLSDPLQQMLSAIRTAGANTQEIVLAPLKLDDLDRLVTDALRREPGSAGPLAQHVHQKTGGNPFFAIQFLTSLADEGLLRFDRDARGWTWDLGRIRAKSYSGNVADLMAGKLQRLSGPTQAALQQFACLGNVARVATLSVACGQLEEELHTALEEALRAGLISLLEDSYAFLHDRIQEAAYTLIPMDERSTTHLRIGRRLLAHTAPEAREAVIFEILSQLNRGMAVITSPEERAQIAELNLIAGMRAQRAAAYAAALTYFAAGRTLLAQDCWTRQYRLTFALEFHCAECEFLTGATSSAAQRLELLASRASGVVDQAAVTCLRVDLYIILVRPERAVEIGLEYLSNVGLELTPQPTDEEIQQEYARIWQRLGTRQIEDLLELPLMSEPGRRATMDVLNKLVVSALYQHPKLHQLLLAHMVNFSMEHGNCAASSVGYATLGRVLISQFGNFAAAARFGQLGLDLVDRRGLDTFKARVYFTFGTGISPWTQHLRVGLTYLRRAAEESRKIGDLPYMGFCHSNIVGNLLSSGHPLAEVDQAATEGLAFAEKTGSGIAVAYIRGQLRLIRSLRGLACDFDTAEFEQRLGADSGLTIAADIYWSRRLQALLFAEDYAAAIEVTKRPRATLSLPRPNIELAEYHFYAALALAGAVGSGDSAAHLEALRAHHQQLQTWANHCRENIASRAALVDAELARLEGRESEAERAYTRAIRTARMNGFINNEALACELAARFYAARGFEDIAEFHLIRARDGYRRWGADSKVRQLEARHPGLITADITDARKSGSGPDYPLDVAAVVKASQALSGEMLLPRLIERLMRITVENAGAERGLLILVRNGEARIEAEATTHPGNIEVATRQTAITPTALAQSVLHYALRTHERVLLDDACADKVYATDDYVRLKRSRSLVCLPIVKQGRLAGALYLENNLTPGAFTPARVTVLELLASQAAISLENAALYADLQRSEAFLAQGQKISHTGSFGWSIAGDQLHWSQEHYNILEYDRDMQPSMDLALERVHPEDREMVRRALEAALRDKKEFDSEHRLLMPDGRIKHVQSSGRAVNTGNLEFVGAVRDVTDRIRAQESLRQAQSDLARINRITIMGELAASLAHELAQPITATLTNADVGLLKLERATPDVDGVRASLGRIARDTQRANEILGRIRSQFQRSPPMREMIDVNELTRETLALLRDEAVRYNISVRPELAADLPRIVGDRVQLQQVAMNLIVNGIEAMKDITGAREIVIRSQRAASEQILVSVSDTGVGFAGQLAEQIFDPFFTTKPHGTGMGLRISRSIIESHGGRLWADGTPGRGATFHLTLPIAGKAAHP